MEDDKGAIRLLVWPRKSSAGAKQLAAFNVAVCELSGWFPVYSMYFYNYFFPIIYFLAMFFFLG